VAEGKAREALGGFALVARVQVVRLAQVDEHGLAGVGHGERAALRLAQLGPATFPGLRRRRVRVGQLAKIEGKVGIAPVRPPIANQGGKGLRVLRGAAHVRLALIPNEAADRVTGDGGNQAVEHARGHRRRPRRGARIGLKRCCGQLGQGELGRDLPCAAKVRRVGEKDGALGHGEGEARVEGIEDPQRDRRFGARLQERRRHRVPSAAGGRRLGWKRSPQPLPR
jgi:hypothetical protein